MSSQIHRARFLARRRAATAEPAEGPEWAEFSAMDTDKLMRRAVELEIQPPEGINRMALASLVYQTARSRHEDADG